MSLLLFLGIILWLDFLLDFFSWRLTISRSLNWSDRFINYLSFFREVEEKDLNVLGSKTVTNSFNDEFHVEPVLRLEVIEDDTSIAVFLSGSLLNHLHQDFLAQVLIVSLANFRLFLTLGRRFLLSLLFLLLFFKSYL
jgi:hypothetical protein